MKQITEQEAQELTREELDEVFGLSSQAKAVDRLIEIADKATAKTLRDPCAGSFQAERDAHRNMMRAWEDLHSARYDAAVRLWGAEPAV